MISLRGMLAVSLVGIAAATAAQAQEPRTLQWQRDYELALFELIEGGGELIAVDSVATNRASHGTVVQRHYFVKHHDGLFRCEEAYKDFTHLAKDRSIACYRLVEPFGDG